MCFPWPRNRDILQRIECKLDALIEYLTDPAHNHEGDLCIAVGRLQIKTDRLNAALKAAQP